VQVTFSNIFLSNTGAGARFEKIEGEMEMQESGTSAGEHRKLACKFGLIIIETLSYTCLIEISRQSHVKRTFVQFDSTKQGTFSSDTSGSSSNTRLIRDELYCIFMENSLELIKLLSINLV
jgi:hypothetical protein